MSLRQIERPVIIAAPPRSGSSMLYEALEQSPSLYTIGAESHGVIESINRLNPTYQGFESNRLTAGDATADIVATLHERFYRALRDRDGKPAPGAVRMLEKTPRNILRLPFLDAVFPDAFFIYLHRDPRATINSMIEAWKSGRFVSYRNLPGWSGPTWSLLLIPGWRELIGRPLVEIAATQWATAMRILIDDLEALPPSRWCIASYDRLVEEPRREIERLCRLAGIDWDREIPARLPISRSALTPPDPNKVSRNLPDLAPADALIADTARRALTMVDRHPT